MVGVNKYESDGDADIPLLRVDDQVQRTQVANLRRVKGERDGRARSSRPSRPCARRREARRARDGSNLMPPIIDAAKAYCTQQEICDVLRDVLGTYSDPAEF